jgi:hypothetical protein
MKFSIDPSDKNLLKHKCLPNEQKRKNLRKKRTK